VLAATDPANPFGATLPWPVIAGVDVTHRPGRKAGAIVVIANGILEAYLERGGRSLLVWTDDEDLLVRALSALAESPLSAPGRRSAVTRVNGGAIAAVGPLAQAMTKAGFLATPQGYRPARAR
jgi:ATP-dependent Lhr-like helicase